MYEGYFSTHTMHRENPKLKKLFAYDGHNLSLSGSVTITCTHDNIVNDLEVPLTLSISISPHLNIPNLSIPFAYDSTFKIYIKQQWHMHLCE